MKIYTRRGDAGRTSLQGGVEVSKTDSRVEAYGVVDELNSALGLALALDPEDWSERADVERVQHDLFALGARLAAASPERALARGTIPRFGADRIETLERWIDRLDTELPELDAFVLPGGCQRAAQLHVARTVCRRAERAVAVLLDEQPGLSRVALPYLNRLSDLLFTLARSTNARQGIPGIRWTPVRETEAGPAQTERPSSGHD